MCKQNKKQNYKITNLSLMQAKQNKETAMTKYISPELRLHWNLKANIIHAATKHANTNTNKIS